MRVTCAQRFGPRSNLRSDPILAVFIHSLSRSPAKIGPEIRFSFRFALAAGMLFAKRNENRAWSPVILEGKSKSNENHRQTKCNIIWICIGKNLYENWHKTYIEQMNKNKQKLSKKSKFWVFDKTVTSYWPPSHCSRHWTPFTRAKKLKKIGTARQSFGTVLTILRHGTPNFGRVNVSVPHVMWHQCSKF